MVDLSIINKLCIKKGITKKKMCDDLGFAPSKVTDMLKKNSTTLANLEKIANYFGVSVGLFFGESAFPINPFNSFIRYTTYRISNILQEIDTICDKYDRMKTYVDEKKEGKLANFFIQEVIRFVTNVDLDIQEINHNLKDIYELPSEARGYILENVNLLMLVRDRLSSLLQDTDYFDTSFKSFKK